MNAEDTKDAWQKHMNGGCLCDPDNADWECWNANGYLEGLEQGRKEEREKAKGLEDALKLAINAFRKNWAIDWNELDESLAKYRKEK